VSVVDTIVAPATPAGVGERAVVRLSGPRAWHALRDVLTDLPPLAPRRLLDARLPLGDGVALPVELMLWRAPHSASGEDLAEVHLPGWPAAVAELLRRLRVAGCRPAQPGEFTRRAVLLGKLDLERAVALGALSRAADAPALAAALDTLVDGGDRALAALREELLATLALLEAHVDHEEEDTEALAEGELPTALAALARRARRLDDDSAARFESEGELAVVLLGPPNAGKSSLMLALCPDAQTTPSPVPGTTRDALSARRRVGARTLAVIDGPGVSWEHAWDDPLDAEAMRLFVGRLPRGAVIVDVEDVTRPSGAEERARRRACAGERPRVEVWNKCDLLAADLAPHARLPVSALSGAGLDALLDAVLAAAPSVAPLAGRHALERQLLDELRPLLEPLDADASPLAREGALPLVALALREALQRLDEHAQRAGDLSEELLDRVFAGFCLGK